MFKSRRAGLLAAACSIGLVAGVGGAHAETLAEAIALAYQTNPTLQGQRANQRALDESYVQARTGYRPTVSGALGASYSHIKPGSPGQIDTNGDGVPDVTVGGSTENNTGSASLTVSQPLYTGGRVSSEVAAAEADVNAGRQNLRSVEQSVVGSVIQSYVDVRRDQERLRISQENVAVLQRQLDESNARFEVGEITRTDVAQSQARLAAARANLASSQAQLAVSRAAYAAVVGQNPGDLAAEPSLAQVLPATVDQAFDSAEQQNPQILAADFTEQASRARVAAAKAAHRPTIGLAGTLGYTGHADPFDADEYDRQIRLSATANVPIFTGGLNSSRVRAAVERNNAARIAIETARRQVLQQVSASWNQLLGARANLVANEEQVRAARIAFEGVRQENQVGLRTTLDVLNAEQELRNAELALVTARRDEYVAASTVLSASGRLEARAIAADVPAYDPVVNFRKASTSVGWVPWEPVVAGVDKIGAPAIGAAPTDAPVATAK
ncbi:TolC family outer membrane protein [Caulobacter sp. NIBR2454]|uniref:TolC family outer membrane protein n=1 Tax=Caulobacter sp. NIBR2454 TaxID=3015996 RepID=UPI0022B70C38|nr:TolC family outer membrane protein [Caulobacter sp. NIBR2454]